MKEIKTYTNPNGYPETFVLHSDHLAAVKELEGEVEGVKSKHELDLSELQRLQTRQKQLDGMVKVVSDNHESLTSKLEIALGALRFYGDKENWTGAQGGIDNDIICSSDMERKIDNKTEIYAGQQAREAIQKIEAL